MRLSTQNEALIRCTKLVEKLGAASKCLRWLPLNAPDSLHRIWSLPKIKNATRQPRFGLIKIAPVLSLRMRPRAGFSTLGVDRLQKRGKHQPTQRRVASTAMSSF